LQGEPNIHRHQRAARHGHAIVHLQHDVAIGAERRDSITLLSARASQQSRETMRAISKLAVRKSPLAVDDGYALCKILRGAIEEVRRVEWRCAAQRHFLLPFRVSLN
jgi:hypothetical protein